MFDKFHIMKPLGEALDKVRKIEHARFQSKEYKSSNAVSMDYVMKNICDLNTLVYAPKILKT